MRSLPQHIVAAFAATEYRACRLLTLGASTPLRFTDLDVPIRYGGNDYEARGFRMDPAQYSLSPEVDRAVVTVDDVDNLILGTALIEELRGKTATIELAVMSASATVDGSTTIFKGLVDKLSFSAGLRSVTVEILSPLALWKRTVPRRKHQTTCPWAFKGTDCAYVGVGASCDQSYDKCAEYLNTANFGGFRYLSTLAEEEIYWGQA